MKIFVLLLSCCFFAGCSHTLKYSRPTSRYDIQNSITIEKSKDQVWSNLIPALSKTFFIINNLDKESGLINVSYSGEPEQFVDCGEIYSFIQNLAGERSYRFPAATAYKEYEIWNEQFLRPVPVKRKMHLDGRINIVIQEIAPNKTQVSAYAKYVIDRDFSTLVPHYAGYSSYSTWENFSDSISFNTGETGVFKSGSTECKCNGKLERTILDLLKE